MLCKSWRLQLRNAESRAASLLYLICPMSSMHLSVIASSCSHSRPMAMMARMVVNLTGGRECCCKSMKSVLNHQKQLLYALIGWRSIITSSNIDLTNSGASCASQVNALMQNASTHLVRRSDR